MFLSWSRQDRIFNFRFPVQCRFLYMRFFLCVFFACTCAHAFAWVRFCMSNDSNSMNVESSSKAIVYSRVTSLSYTTRHVFERFGGQMAPKHVCFDILKCQRCRVLSRPDTHSPEFVNEDVVEEDDTAITKMKQGKLWRIRAMWQVRVRFFFIGWRW